jgi:hypothetical protein
LKTVHIYTALWNVDTKISERGRAQNQLRNLSPIERYRLLDRVVGDAWLDMYDRRQRDFARLEERPDWLYLFVAPEYYFAASDRAHAIPQDVKENIIGRLMELSGRFSNLILAPGTIAWKKPVLRSGSQVYHRNSTTLKESARLDKFIARNTAAVNLHAATIPHQVDLWIADRVRDASDSSDVRRFRSPGYRRDRTDFYEQDLVEGRQANARMVSNLRASQDRCYIARNTAYAFRAGREVARYHKRGNYFEVFASESDGGYVIYEPGGGPEATGDRFEVDQVKFGIEVCLDHQLGLLSHLGGFFPDVQIIMSADVQFLPHHTFVSSGGYVVHASSNSACIAIYRNDRGRIRQVVTTDQQTLVGELRYATLELTIHDGPLIIDDYYG